MAHLIQVNAARLIQVNAARFEIAALHMSAFRGKADITTFFCHLWQYARLAILPQDRKIQLLRIYCVMKSGSADLCHA